MKRFLQRLRSDKHKSVAVKTAKEPQTNSCNMRPSHGRMSHGGPPPPRQPGQESQENNQPPESQMMQKETANQATMMQPGAPAESTRTVRLSMDNRPVESKKVDEAEKKKFQKVLAEASPPERKRDKITRALQNDGIYRDRRTLRQRANDSVNDMKFRAEDYSPDDSQKCNGQQTDNGGHGPGEVRLHSKVHDLENARQNPEVAEGDFALDYPPQTEEAEVEHTNRTFGNDPRPDKMYMMSKDGPEDFGGHNTDSSIPQQNQPIYYQDDYIYPENGEQGYPEDPYNLPPNQSLNAVEEEEVGTESPPVEATSLSSSVRGPEEMPAAPLSPIIIKKNVARRDSSSRKSKVKVTEDNIFLNRPKAKSYTIDTVDQEGNLSLNFQQLILRRMRQELLELRKKRHTTIQRLRETTNQLSNAQSDLNEKVIEKLFRSIIRNVNGYIDMNRCVLLKSNDLLTELPQPLGLSELNKMDGEHVTQKGNYTASAQLTAVDVQAASINLERSRGADVGEPPKVRWSHLWKKSPEEIGAFLNRHSHTRDSQYKDLLLYLALVKKVPTVLDELYTQPEVPDHTDESYYAVEVGKVVAKNLVHRILNEMQDMVNKGLINKEVTVKPVNSRKTTDLDMTDTTNSDNYFANDLDHDQSPTIQILNRSYSESEDMFASMNAWDSKTNTGAMSDLHNNSANIFPSSLTAKKPPRPQRKLQMRRQCS